MSFNEHAVLGGIASQRGKPSVTYSYDCKKFSGQLNPLSHGFVAVRVFAQHAGSTAFKDVAGNTLCSVRPILLLVSLALLQAVYDGQQIC